MRRSSMVKRSATRLLPADGPIVASALAETARDLAQALPILARKAEAGGLQIVAQHLNKALQLAERVAATGAAPADRGSEPV